MVQVRGRCRRIRAGTRCKGWIACTGWSGQVPTNDNHFQILALSESWFNGYLRPMPASVSCWAVTIQETTSCLLGTCSLELKRYCILFILPSHQEVYSNSADVCKICARCARDVCKVCERCAQDVCKILISIFHSVSCCQQLMLERQTRMLHSIRELGLH